MDKNLYEILIEKLGQLKSAVDDYLQATPVQSIQGDRGAVKGAFNELEEALLQIPEPAGADEGEATDDTVDMTAEDVDDNPVEAQDAPNDDEELADKVNENDENPDGDDVVSDEEENIENADSSGDEQESNDSKSEEVKE